MAGLLDFFAKSGQWLGRKGADIYEKMNPQAGGEGGVPLRPQVGTPPFVPRDDNNGAGGRDKLARPGPQLSPPIARPEAALPATAPAPKFAEPSRAAGILPPSAPPGAARPTPAGLTSNYEDYLRKNVSPGPIMNAPEPTFAEPAARWGGYKEDDPRFGGSWQNKGWKRTLLGAGLGFLQGVGATGSIGGGIGGAITGGVGSAASPDAAKSLYANAWLRPQEDAEMRREYQRQRLGLDLRKDQLGVQEAEARIGKTKADTDKTRWEMQNPGLQSIPGIGGVNRQGQVVLPVPEAYTYRDTTDGVIGFGNRGGQLVTGRQPYVKPPEEKPTPYAEVEKRAEAIVNNRWNPGAAAEQYANSERENVYRRLGVTPEMERIARMEPEPYDENNPNKSLVKLEQIRAARAAVQKAEERLVEMTKEFVENQRRSLVAREVEKMSQTGGVGRPAPQRPASPGGGAPAGMTRSLRELSNLLP